MASITACLQCHRITMSEHSRICILNLEKRPESPGGEAGKRYDSVSEVSGASAREPALQLSHSGDFIYRSYGVVTF
jgi:hypothetical protein